MSNVSLAATGQKTQADTVSGPTSYTSGGTGFSTDLGRVDTATIETNNEAYEATVTGIASNNEMTVVVVNTSDGVELAGGTDLSADDFTFTATMN